MIETKEETVKTQVKTSFICDICKKRYDVKDWREVQEFHHINFTGGYDSVFGDCVKVECDICQHCLLRMIKDYMRCKIDSISGK